MHKLAWIFLWILLSVVDHSFVAAKVVNYGDNLAQLVDMHPDKNWLINFHSPWCHQCKKLEPTFFNVAETIYHEHEHLIVGRVDCTRYSAACQSFNIQSYPTILFVNKQTRVIYNGKRSHDQLVDFARRLAGPDINSIESCQQFHKLTQKHELIVVSDLRNSSDPIQAEFLTLSKLLKPNFWFYQMTMPCKSSFAIDGEIFILKRHLKHAIRFNQSSSVSQSGASDASNGENKFRSSIISWLNWNSFPVYGEIDRRNIDQILSYSSLLVMAILDHYEPAKRFMPTSVQLHESFGNLSSELAEREPAIDSLPSRYTTFGWTSDINLIASIIIDQFVVPNLIFLKPDYSHYLHLRDKPPASEKDEHPKKLPKQLEANSLKFVISQAKTGKLKFEGGSQLMTSLRRRIFTTAESFKSMYTSNALLTLLLFGLPTSIVLFVVYTTCLSERSPSAVARDEEEQEALLRNNQRAATRNNHQHQD